VFVWSVIPKKESTTNSTCPPLFALPSPFNINMDQQEGETEGPTLALMESYRCVCVGVGVGVGGV